MNPIKMINKHYKVFGKVMFISVSVGVISLVGYKVNKYTNNDSVVEAITLTGVVASEVVLFSGGLLACAALAFPDREG